MASKYEVVFCVVNGGFSEAVMESARAAGARGGTVLSARGTANPRSEKFFGITILPNKEIVMILVDSAVKEEVLHNVQGRRSQNRRTGYRFHSARKRRRRIDPR